MRNEGMVRGKSVTAILALVLMTGTMNVPLLAQENSAGGARVEGELSLEFETDQTFKSDNSGDEITDSYPTIGLGVSWIFNPYFSINGAFTAEPVFDPDPGADRMFFEDVGLYAGELYAQLQVGPARLFAGKFGASFGQAWGLAPGLYGTDFNEDYEMSERVGVGAGLSGEGTPLGDIDLTLNAFTLDTSGLSRSVFTKRVRPVLADGGAGNTGELDSYSLTLDGRNLALLPGIAWHLGYSHQEKGTTANDLFDETGFVAGLYGAHKLSDDLSFAWVGEVAALQNAGGGADDVTYVTLGGVVTLMDRYNLAVAHTTRSFDIAVGPDYEDTTTQISAGMEIYDGWTVDVGVKFVETQNVKSQTAGVLLAKTFAFSTGD